MKNTQWTAMLAALAVLPGAARATNPCDASPEACKEWSQSLSVSQSWVQDADRLRQTIDERRQAQASAAVPVATVIARLSAAAERLIAADAVDAATRRSDQDLDANPYRAAPGDNGKVDSKEAAATHDALAISLYDAAADYLGVVYEEGGGPGGFVDKIMPEFEVGYGELRLFEQHVERIVSRLDTDKAGTLDEAKMSGLAAAIASYSKEQFRGEPPSSARLSPLAWGKVETAVRQAYAGAESPVASR
jgi:hypothetical protein